MATNSENIHFRNTLGKAVNTIALPLINYYCGKQTFVETHSGFASRTREHMKKGMNIFQAAEHVQKENIGTNQPLSMKERRDLYGNIALGTAIEMGGRVAVKVAPKSREKVTQAAQWAWDRFDWGGTDTTSTKNQKFAIRKDVVVEIKVKGGTSDDAQGFHDRLLGGINHTNPEGDLSYGAYFIGEDVDLAELQQKIKEFNNDKNNRRSKVTAQLRSSKSSERKGNDRRERYIDD